MTRSVIVSTVRTPFGRLGGGLAGHAATELGSIAIRAGLERAGVDPAEVGYVVMGQVLQAGVGQAPARQAAVGAGIPKEVPADTINKVCASSIRAIELADLMIRAGQHDVVVTGGMESMSNAPVPPAEGALRLPARQRRGDRPHGLRRAHVDVRRRPHGRPGVARGPRARDLPRVAGRMGSALAVARRSGTGRRAFSPRRSSLSAISTRTRASGATRPSRSSRR